MAHRKFVWLSALIAALIVLSTASPLTLAKNPSPEELTGPVVVRLYFDSRDQLDAIAAQYDVWEVDHDLGYAVVMLSPAEYETLRSQGYQMEIDEEKTWDANHTLGIPSYPCYRTVEETYTSLQTLASTYPTLVTLVDIGDSWDKVTSGGPAGYDVNMLHITNSNIGGAKPTFFLMAEIHAREYVTAETATRFAEYLLQNYGTDPEITFFVDYYNIYIVPMTNPDGRKFAETGELWRKNTDNDDGCTSYPDYGTDLNRNYAFKWGGAGTYPCGETYQGPSAGSEPETQIIQNYVLTLFPDQRGPGDSDPAPADATGLLITLHSYSGLVLWPWGWTSGNAPNAAQLQAIGTKLATYNGYTPEQSSDLYPTTGSTDDWSYGTLGIASFTFEMGTQFFQGCTSFESTIWPDNLDSLLYAMKIPETPYMTAYGPDALNAVVAPTSVPQGTPVQLTGTINDQNNGNQVVQAAEYFVLPLHGGTLPGDPGTGTPMSAADGSWSSNVENVVATVDTSALAPGDHIIAVRGRDAGSNWGPFTAVFLNTTTGSTPEQIDVEATPASIPVVYGQATVTATLSLLDGTPVAGWPVTFTVTNGLGTVDPVTVISNMDGHAVTTLSAGATPGTAHVSAESADLDDSVDVEIYIPDAPTAAFSSDSPVCIGSPVAFTNLSSGPAGIPLSYLWDFGDGTTSSEESPEHLYAAAGIYTVVMTATNVGGSDAATGTVTVDPAPEAAFSFSPLYPQEGQPVHFYDASTNGPTAWQWTFGDDSGASIQNPIHTYAAAGTYTVSLRASNTCGWSDYYQQEIVIGGQPEQYYIYLPVVIK